MASDDLIVGHTHEGCNQAPDPFSNGIFYNDQPLNHVLPLFLLQIVIMVFTSHSIYYLLRPFKQPRVVSDILAGIFVGPTLPYLVAQVLDFFHGFLHFDAATLNYDTIKQRYLDILYQEEGIGLMRTAAFFGLTLHFFVVCVQMNLSDIKRSGKKVIVIGLASSIGHYILLGQLEYFLIGQSEGKTMIEGLGHPLSIRIISLTMSWTSFPVVASILAELRLLNTDLGRLTMSASVVGDMAMTIYSKLRTIYKQVTVRRMTILKTSSNLVGYVILALLLMFVFRPWMRWIVRKTPKGGRIWEGHVLMVILSVLAMTIFSDAYLSSFFDAAIFMGLVVPDGPPLGTALVEKISFIPNELLVMLTYLSAGRWVDFTTFKNPKMVLGLVSFMFVGHIVKVLTVVVPALYCNMPIRNALLMGLMLCFNGLVQIANYMGLADEYSGRTLLVAESYSSVILVCAIITGTSSALVATYYDPLNSNHIMGCRTVQHLKPQTEFRLVVSVLNEEPVPLIINLMEALCTNEQNPICIYVLHLVELMGRAASSLIAHKNRKGNIDTRQMDSLHTIFINYEQAKKGIVVVQPFTAISPYKTMYHDICLLAMEKSVHFIIVPYPRKEFGANAELDHATRNIIVDVLAQAPCSVGILVHHTFTSFKQPVPGQFQYNVKILFWGGHDDREALSIGMRIAQHEGINVLVTRFISTIGHDQKKDKELIWDEETFRDFKMSTARENVVVEEVMANDVEQTVSIIKAMEKEYDLVIVGRRQGSNSLLATESGMEEWIESPELGVVGDILASSDFANFSFSILVVQQYV